MARFLIISDTADACLALQQTIIDFGYDCDLRSSDADALAAMPYEAYDLICCDTHLKSASGFDLMRSILEQHHGPGAVMVANEASVSLSEELLKIEALDYISLPIDWDRVRVTLANALHRRKIENENRKYESELRRLTQQRPQTADEHELKSKQLSKALESAQKKIINAEKMAAIGQLAAGVAHEINNPVGFVASNLNTLNHYQKSIAAMVIQYRKLLAEIPNEMLHGKKQTQVRKRYDRIRRLEKTFDINYLQKDMRALLYESLTGVSRVKKIVRDLKAFVHPGQNSPEPVDIHKQLDATLNLVWNKLKYNIKVEKEYGELPLVKCRAGQLNQVFLNIIVNAVQAIEAKGTIALKTQVVADDQVEICISDSGRGIPAEDLPKIFDPFFTTKPVGQGTGLGLHMSHNIIKDHNGTLVAESKQGHGTTFKIRLPIDRQTGGDEDNFIERDETPWLS